MSDLTNDSANNQTWKCSCGHENNTNFCINCGKKREDGEIKEKKDDTPVVVASSIAAAASVGKVDIPDELKANIQKQAEPVQPVFQPQPQPQMQQPYQPMVQQPQQMQQQQVFAPQTQQPVQPQYQQQYQPQYQQQYQPQYMASSQTNNVSEDELMEKRKKLSNRLSLISLICHLSYIFGSFIIGVIEYALEEGGSTGSSLALEVGSTAIGTLFTASIVLMIIARVKCRTAKFAKVLMIVYIIEVALLVIAVVLVIVLIFYAIIACT
ncbi:MAG: hypothetical protein J6U23_09080 [Clostridiales bacterium]|nr:hypothetical protein [Clostridiales bacterium]